MPNWGFVKKMAVKTGMIGRRHQRSRKEESEFGLAGKEFVLCSECGCAFFDKAWHHRLEEEKLNHLKGGKELNFELCPACKMKKDKIFEGELIIRIRNDAHPRQAEGEAGESRIKNDVLGAIKNSDKQAQERDPMDRVLWTEEREDGLHVFTSENQLAVKIGKKLESSFPGSKMEINHSGEDLIRVIWEN